MSHHDAATRVPSDEVKNIEAVEASCLSAATASMHDAANRVEEQNERLQRLIARRQALSERLRLAIAEARTERHAIEQEVDDILRPTPRRGRTSSAEATR